MKIRTTSLLCLAVAAIAGGCTTTQPSLTAFQRNVGPGSTVTGVPSDSRGTPNSGDTQVPGVSSAGATLR